MKYAVIADIHGNLPALKAVLRDAEEQQVQRYIFLGDYCCGFPDTNEVLTSIRSMQNAAVIRGNEDDYVHRLRDSAPNTWTDGQFCTVYWTYRSLIRENLNFLSSLPEELHLDNRIRCFHKPHHLFTGTVLELGCYEYSRDRHLFSCKKAYDDWFFLQVHDDKRLRGILSGLQKGVYLFGHTHMQWHMEVGGKLLVNPGSCGLPLDDATTSPYTIIEQTDCGFSVEERRCAYDLDETVVRLKSSPLYGEAPVWSDIIISELTTGIESVIFFLNHAAAYADSIGDPIRPFTRETFADAYNDWLLTRT